MSKHFKLQVAFENGLPADIEELEHVSVFSKTGKVAILIVSGQKVEFLQTLEKRKPLLLEELPLTLEDLFFLKDGGELYV